MNQAVIIPTGDELRQGVVLDTDSPEIMGQLLRLFPCCQVLRVPPLADDQDAIGDTLVQWATTGADLIVFIGGSGGGHRHSGTLGKDYTHSALEQRLEDCVSRAIYGKNGHMWCKLFCGKMGNTLVVNLPGPFVEAQAAFEAFCRVYPDNPQDFAAINSAMAKAVMAQYG